MQASCGWRHSALVIDDGSLYVAGDNEHGQLGLGESHEAVEGGALSGVVCPRMTRVPGLDALTVVQVSCGRSHTAFVCDAGELFSMGLGLYGQLGVGALVSESQPRRVPNVGGGAAFVSCGDLHTLVLRADGRALSCGFNEAGRLGRLLDEEATCAESLGVLPLHAAAAGQSDAFAIIALSAGGAHSALITADGSAYTCGRGEQGQLGHGKESVQASGEDGGGEKLPRRVAALKQHKIRRAALGQSHSLFLSQGGIAFSCGCGMYGRLGHGGRETSFVPMPVRLGEAIVVVQVSAGAAHSSFVTDTGAVYLCGDDSTGQLGLDRGKTTSLVPLPPSKFEKKHDGVVVLGASCGGQHTAFLLRTVVDAKEDYRADQIAHAATVIEALFRGNHQRHLSDAVRQRKRGGRADVHHSAKQRDMAASVLQAAWRLHLGVLERERREQLRQLRALRDHADDDKWWGRIQRQFDAASVSNTFAEAHGNRTIIRPSW